MKAIGPDPSWLKVVQRPAVYDTRLPDFVDLGTTVEWGMQEHVDALARFVAGYDWRNSPERTDEYGFRRSVRIMPAVDYLIAHMEDGANVAWGKYRFNDDPALVRACNGVIDTLLPRFATATGSPWRGLSIQLAGMQPGVILRPHVDGYLPHEVGEKIHIPLTTNARCRQITFDKGTGLARSIDHLQPGRLYCINNLEPHSACNLGEDVRWHVIVDIMETATWLETKARARRDYPEVDDVYRVNPEYTRLGNASFYAAFEAAHGTQEPRRYVHSLFSGAAYYTRDNRKVGAIQQ